MKNIRTSLCAALTCTLGACASSPPVQYFALDDGRPIAVRSWDGPSIAVAQVNLPELVDRPQLVVRKPGHQLQINDQYAWAEPLRQQIPRLLARDLGEELDAFNVVALPVDAQDYGLDFYLTLDIQRLEVISGQGVSLDVIWRVASREGKTLMGRAMVWEAVAATDQKGEYGVAVAAQSRALKSLSRQIAGGITRWIGSAAPGAPPTDRIIAPQNISTKGGWRHVV